LCATFGGFQATLVKPSKNTKSEFRPIESMASATQRKTKKWPWENYESSALPLSYSGNHFIYSGLRVPLRCQFDLVLEVVQANATPSTAQTAGQRQHGGGQYSKVFDQRKRRIRGL
jgi:hypothetical protein